MYTLGGRVISADDDMRPYALIENSVETLGDHEICRGKLLKSGERNGYEPKSFDIVSAFVDVLGKRVADVPRNYERGRGPAVTKKNWRMDCGVAGYDNKFCRPSSPRVCDSKTTSIGSGSSRKESWPPTSTPRRTI